MNKINKSQLQKAFECLGFTKYDYKNSVPLSQIQKRYYSLALKHHPDKHIEKDEEERFLNAEKFKEINEAFFYIKRIYETETTPETTQEDLYSDDIFTNININIQNIHSFTIDAIIRHLLRYIFKVDIDTEIIIHFLSLTHKYSLDLFKVMECEKAIKLYKILSRYATLFNIEPLFLKELHDILKERVKNYIFIDVSIRDILSHNVFVYDLKNKNGDKSKKIYIPMWAYNMELEYKFENETYIFVTILDNKEYIYNEVSISINDIDLTESQNTSQNTSQTTSHYLNNIIVLFKEDIKNVLENGFIKINIGTPIFNTEKEKETEKETETKTKTETETETETTLILKIKAKDLKIQKEEQIFIIEKQGAPIFNEDDPLNDKELGNIEVHISLF